MEACLIVTYRCNARCHMCDTWQHPSRPDAEFSPSLLHKLPDGLRFMNITGGEPFLRSDLAEIVEIALRKSKRVVVSSNGYLTDRILALADRFGPRLGIRISIEGLPAANDELRGLKDGFDHGLRTLLELGARGFKDIGFGITVSDRNVHDLMELYRLADAMGLEFATAVTHNSFYFHKTDNAFAVPERITTEFERLAGALLSTRSPKKWFRAYFNMGLANKVQGGERPLPCEAGTDVFFLDPAGNVMPCNGSAEPMVMGSLHAQDFESIWSSDRAREVRGQVATCSQQCWMIGSAAPAMKKRITVPGAWVIRNKLRQFRLGNGGGLDPVGFVSGERE
ncbi:radical SAM protein [Desulfovibrio ferrophilus]|uniref:Fe-S oxidoreductase n=1 Tax=Desulfovibrio ferrophilus TaxID=241368 RepID=A0A2Z6B1C4_9BACT|nr:radical SAM protein [Desulfovibrio ferrophilus]BBD09263.1 Fe-S oxidoreductase [Desulfovibrio ferrophilus]